MRVLPVKPARNSNRLPQLFAALIAVLVVTLSVTGFVWAQKDITLVVDGKSKSFKTSASDVAGVLAQQSVRLGASDVVNPASDTSIRSGMTITLRHAVPVQILAGGSKTSISVVGATVGDALVAAGLSTDGMDAVPGLTTSLRSGMIIKVPDAFLRLSTKKTTIPVSTKQVKDPHLPKGAKRVVRRGHPGLVLRVYQSIVTEGTSSTPVLTAQKVIAEAESRVVAIGTGESDAATGPSDTPRPKPDKAPSAGMRMRVLTTGYSPRQKGLDFTTATGKRAGHGVMAVDPRVIPLGTRVYVPGYGYAVAADTGGSVRGKEIDLCFDSVAQARAWGRRTVTIVIVK